MDLAEMQHQHELGRNLSFRDQGRLIEMVQEARREFAQARYELGLVHGAIVKHRVAVTGMAVKTAEALKEQTGTEFEIKSFLSQEDRDLWDAVPVEFAGER